MTRMNVEEGSANRVGAKRGGLVAMANEVSLSACC